MGNGASHKSTGCDCGERRPPVMGVSLPREEVTITMPPTSCHKGLLDPKTIRSLQREPQCWRHREAGRECDESQDDFTHSDEEDSI